MAIVLLHATVAVADERPSDAPWEAGVNPRTRAKAQALFEEGNVLFAQQAHAPALAKYKAAIVLWDHPLIRLNMAITEVRLDRVLEAAEDLEAALRYGAAPFDEIEYRKALAQQTLIAGRVGRIQASCTEPGAQVLLDGAQWLTCPGRGSRPVLAGPHVLLGEKAGYLTVSRRVTVAGGDTAIEALTFVPLDQAITYTHPTPRWIPWTVAGGGAAVTLGGIAIAVSATRQMKRFDAAFAKRCAMSCEADLSDVPDLKRTKDAAETKSTIAVPMMIAGGATLVAGVVWATWFNRARRVMPTLEVYPEGGADVRVSWQF